MWLSSLQCPRDDFFIFSDDKAKQAVIPKLHPKGITTGMKEFFEPEIFYNKRIARETGFSPRFQKRMDDQTSRNDGIPGKMHSINIVVGVEEEVALPRIIVNFPD
jgi:hypothetical protein